MNRLRESTQQPAFAKATAAARSALAVKPARQAINYQLTKKENEDETEDQLEGAGEAGEM